MRLASVGMVMLGLLGACQTMPRGEAAAAGGAVQPDGARLQGYLDHGQYRLAMRELPVVMKQWAEYTQRTGETAEGSAGYIYGRTMDEIVAHGGSQWGEILDDREIPYVYKTEIIFEILEGRLGKGAVYMGNEKNFIVPRYGRIDLKDMIKLPQ
jgi:hypothetical protein